MGWFSNLLEKITEKPTQTKYAEVMNGYAPIFSQFGTNIYASDVVQQAINCIVQEVKKLKPQHIRENGMDVIPVNGDIQAVLNNPNPLMTTSDFLEKITWLLFLNYNVFIVPIYKEWTDNKGVKQRKYEALYPITPSEVYFIEDASNRIYVEFRFANGHSYTLKYSDIIHIRKNYSVNQYMGGNETGQPDNSALLKTLEINHNLLQGIAQAMKSSYSVNAVVKYNTMLDEGKTEAALKELEAKLKKSESGFLPLDLKAEFIPIKKEIKMVDTDTLKFIDSKILRNYGVSLPILTGEYTKEDYEAFYQKTIESIVISFTQAFTKGLFTDRQQSGYNNIIKFYPKELIFLSTSQKIEVINMLSQTGSIFENEKRTAFGFAPLPELAGKRYMSLNWVDVDIAKQYQLGDNSGGDSNGSE